jgi:formiminotetrahydrofolate cyclodeaminase
MHESFLSSLSSGDQPIPGGGAAAAYAGIVGLALFEKIVRVELRRHQNDSGHILWKDLLARISASAETLYRLRDEDGKSYMRLAQAKASVEKTEEVASALEQAIECPMKIMEQSGSALIYVSTAAKHCKGHLLSDLQAVCELLGAAGRGAYHIARANLRLMADPAVKTDRENMLDSLFSRSREAQNEAEDSILGRIK